MISDCMDGPLRKLRTISLSTTQLAGVGVTIARIRAAGRAVLVLVAVAVGDRVGVIVAVERCAGVTGGIQAARITTSRIRINLAMFTAFPQANHEDSNDGQGPKQRKK